MNQFVFVAMGGAIGAGLRHMVNLAGQRIAGAGFPWHTLAVNIAGCFAMGVLVEVLARRFGGSPELGLFLLTGVLGGFTTFSAFSLDFAVLWERGATQMALFYLFASVVGSLVAVFLGLFLARALA